MIRRACVLVALTLFLAAGPANAQGPQSITIDHVDGQYLGNLFSDGNTVIRFWLRYQNPEALNFNISNGFRIYSPDGRIWNGPVKGDTAETGILPRSNWDLGFAMNVFTGATEDTLGILGARINTPGMPPNFNGVPYAISIGSISPQYEGQTLCIDSAWFRPGGAWKWAAPNHVNRIPTWGGPYCYPVSSVICKKAKNPPVNPFPMSITSTHCREASFTFTGEDQCMGDPLHFHKLSGPGSIDSATGTWIYTPSLADVGTHLVLSVRGENQYQQTDGAIDIIITNESPVIAGPIAPKLVPIGSCRDLLIPATDSCNDSIHYIIENITPTDPNVTITLNSNSGVLHCCMTNSAPLSDYSVKVWASDSKDSASATVIFRGLPNCCVGIRGNVDADPEDLTDLSDLMAVIDFLFLGGTISGCPVEANVDGSADGLVDISDLQKLTDYLFFDQPMMNCY